MNIISLVLNAACAVKLQLEYKHFNRLLQHNTIKSEPKYVK